MPTPKKGTGGRRKTRVSAQMEGNRGEVVLYREPGGRIDLQVRLEADTLWLSQKQMAELFATERSVVTKHLRNVFASGELAEKSNVQKMHIAGSDKPVAFYSLDAILSVGYRVNSKRGTQFRIWATGVPRNHLRRGYTQNERRLRTQLGEESSVPVVEPFRDGGTARCGRARDGQSFDSNLAC
jgi:hypothetical protein